MKIIKGFETRAAGIGKYKTTAVIKGNASQTHIKWLFDVLNKNGFAAKPCMLGKDEFGFYISAKDDDGIKEKFADEFSVGETLQRTIASYIDEGAVAETKNQTLQARFKAEKEAFDKKEARKAIKNPKYIKQEFNAKKPDATGINKIFQPLNDKLSAFLQQGTRQDRLERAMRLYAVGDVLGVGVGVANHDPKDAAFAAFAGAATGLGYLELKFSDGNTKAQSLAARILSEDKPEEASTVGDAGKDFVKTNGMHFFNLFNFASFVPITQAGAAQGNIPKLFAGILGLGAWFIRSFIPQKGYSSLVDIEKVGKDSGIEDAFNKFEERNPQIGGVIRDKWDEIRENPANISGILNQVRNVLMYGITAWSWTVGPAEMAGIEHKYATGEDTGYKRSWVDKVMAVPAKITGLFVKKENKIQDPKRFHQCDDSGKVIKHWWEMTHEESQNHLKGLSGKLNAKEHKELEKDISKYWHKKWSRTGGLLNLMMITSYFAANTILKGDKEVEALNLAEVYSQLSLAAMAKDPSHRDKFITDIALKASFEPEIREHPEFIKITTKEDMASKIKEHIYSAINAYEKSPLKSFFTKSNIASNLYSEASNRASARNEKGSYVWNPLATEAAVGMQAAQAI